MRDKPGYLLHDAEAAAEVSRSGTHPKGSEVAGAFRHIDAVLRALPPAELESLVRRVGVRIDLHKRIDVAAQVARALVGLPELRDPTRLPPHARTLLLRVAEAKGLLHVSAVPNGFEPLMARGILFGCKVDSASAPSATIEIVLPNAFLLQLPCWQNEDPRGMRALLAQAPFDTLNAIATHYLGRPATPPIALALETAWDHLSNPSYIAEELARLPSVERRLIEAIESAGGEVETPELLDLEREPMRLRNAKGVSASRRGAGFALERRGFLIPIHPNRHVVPTEVGEIVGAERRRSSSQQRATVRAHVLSEDHAPRRARFANEPAGIALAAAIAAREASNEIRPQVGTPRSLLLRMAHRFGRTSETMNLVSALSRAVGLWEGSALSLTSPPGSFAVGELSALLFSTWRKGNAWDEARSDGETLRAAPEQRDPSPARSMREIALDALADLGEDSWLPYGALERYALHDPRFDGIDRLLRRWFERVGAERAERERPEQRGERNSKCPEPVAVFRRITLESLPALGILDLGADHEEALAQVSRADFDSAAVLEAISIRLTARGKAMIARTNDPLPHQVTPPSQRTSDVERSRFVDNQVLRIGPETLVATALFLGLIAEVGRVEEGLDLIFSSTTIARAISLGTIAEELRERIESVAALPQGLSQLLTQASVVVGKGSLVRSAGFLWIEDQEVRELLRTRRTTEDLFLDPSPPSGLLLAPEVDMERMVRRCRALGVEVDLGTDGFSARPADVRATRSRSSTTTAALSRTPSRTRTPLPRSSRG